MNLKRLYFFLKDTFWKTSDLENPNSVPPEVVKAFRRQAKENGDQVNQN